MDITSELHEPWSDDLQLMEGEQTVEAELDWAPGVVRVEVTDGQRPLDDAVVRWLGPGRLPPYPVDDHGHATVRLAPGTWQILASSPTAGIAQQPLDVPVEASDRMDVTVVIQPPTVGVATLALRVVDPSGGPIEGAVVPSGETVRIEGEVSDGHQSADELLVVFLSDVDGLLGTPAVDTDGTVWMNAGPLTPGEHRITLQVSDELEASDPTVVVVNVSTGAIISTVAPFVVALQGRSSAQCSNQQDYPNLINVQLHGQSEPLSTSGMIAQFNVNTNGSSITLNKNVTLNSNEVGGNFQSLDCVGTSIYAVFATKSIIVRLTSVPTLERVSVLDTQYSNLVSIKYVPGLLDGIHRSDTLIVNSLRHILLIREKSFTVEENAFEIESPLSSPYSNPLFLQGSTRMIVFSSGVESYSFAFNFPTTSTTTSTTSSY